MEQLTTLARVAGGGMADYVADWRARDYLCERQVELQLPEQTLSGRVRGVDDNGLLLLETGSGLSRFSSGELRVRPIPGTSKNALRGIFGGGNKKV